MIDGIDLFLKIVGVFFIIYLIGYSTFLFLSVVVGSSELYKIHRQKTLQNFLPNDYFIPISIIVPAYNEEVTVVETV
ncbi:MAG: glycosyltransferase family 2 protein, partial [Clostridia bacterium]|nr:glycosyltransferase family 2 protein [Clostridia bacterium]